MQNEKVISKALKFPRASESVFGVRYIDHSLSNERMVYDPLETSIMNKEGMEDAWRCGRVCGSLTCQQVKTEHQRLVGLL